MHRRTVLAGLACVVTGCLGSGSGTDETTSTRPTRTPPETTGSATTATTTESTTTETTTDRPYDLVPARPASMTTSEVRDLLAAHECSELTDHPAICPGDDARLDVSVSPTVGRLSATTVTYTVENQADEPFLTGYYHWKLHKWDGDEWRRLAPLAAPAQLDELRAGASHTHRLTPVEEAVPESQLAYVTTSDIRIGGLGPGVYGFWLDGYFESTPDDELAPAAVFGLAGEAPAIRPTDDVTNVERGGSILMVHADASDTDLGERELTVSFVDESAEVSLLPEHVQQLGALLNTLSYAATDGIDQIRYRGYAGRVNMVESYLSLVTPNTLSDSGYNDYKSTRFGFRDYVFEVSINER